ncbi:fukutin related protein [Anaeramoeba flamelloides]|uniref:Fukutin related protein n=1 Tax=Anaeramoeba flamelloides TaxID=1746091 RepID=A0ABQ8XI44_9EUKA|nr:fukutin related protein [Anaeramoeba flamelloides]
MENKKQLVSKQKLFALILIVSLLYFFFHYSARKNSSVNDEENLKMKIKPYTKTETETETENDSDLDEEITEDEIHNLPKLTDLITFVILKRHKTTYIKPHNHLKYFDCLKVLQEFDPDLNLIVLDYQVDSDWYRETIKTPYAIFIEDGFQYMSILNDTLSNGQQIKMLQFKTKGGNRVLLRNLLDIFEFNQLIDVLSLDSWFPYEYQPAFKDWKQDSHVETIEKHAMPHYYPQNDCNNFQKVRNGWPKACDLLTSSFIFRTSMISKSLGNWKPYLYQNEKQDFFFKLSKDKIRLIDFSNVCYGFKSNWKSHTLSSLVPLSSLLSSSTTGVIPFFLKTRNSMRRRLKYKKIVKLDQSGIIYMGVSHQRNGHLWIGCKNHTLRCDFNYLFRGTNLPPCCVRKLSIMVNSVNEILAKYNIPNFIDRGSLLAVQRNETRIPWDTDEDISILGYHFRKYQQEIYKEIEARGLIIEENAGCKVSWSKSNNNYIDLYNYELHEDEGKPLIGEHFDNLRHGIMRKRGFKHAFHSDWIFPTKETNYFNHKHNIPKKSEEYITLLFGEDYHLKKRHFSMHASTKCAWFPSEERIDLCKKRSK